MLATAMWKNPGVTFVPVTRDDPAAFRVVYRQRPETGGEAVLARSFFPCRGSPEGRTLEMYAYAFAGEHVHNQANFLAHEVGHILGLRHEFAPEKEGDLRSVTWMKRSPCSVMRYYRDSSHWHVTQQDVDEVQAFYDYTATEHAGMRLDVVTPELSVYPREQ